MDFEAGVVGWPIAKSTVGTPSAAKSAMRARIEPDYQVVLVLDDRNRVVARRRKVGLLVYQVAYGDF